MDATRPGSPSTPTDLARNRRWARTLAAILIVSALVVAGGLGYWLGRTGLGSTSSGHATGSGVRLAAHVEGRASSGGLTNLSGLATHQ